MEFLSKVRYEEVLGRWLIREYRNEVRNGTVPPGYESLVFDEDYSDPLKNQQRRNLMQYRYPLICPIPTDTEWYEVGVVKEDLTSFRVIKEMSWNVLSNETGKIADAVSNFHKWSQNPQHIPAIQHPDVKEWFIRLMKAIPKYRNCAGDANLNLMLILVGASKENHFTIIEGNKTTMGLYLHYFIDHPELPYPNHRAYVGISTAMTHYRWHHSI